MLFYLLYSDVRVIIFPVTYNIIRLSRERLDVYTRVIRKTANGFSSLKGRGEKKRKKYEKSTVQNNCFRASIILLLWCSRVLQDTNVDAKTEIET